MSIVNMVEEEVRTAMANTMCRNVSGTTLSAATTIGPLCSESSTRRAVVAVRDLGVGVPDGQPK